MLIRIDTNRVYDDEADKVIRIPPLRKELADMRAQLQALRDEPALTNADLMAWAKANHPTTASNSTLKANVDYLVERIATLEAV
jgi:hypothetical protein